MISKIEYLIKHNIVLQSVYVIVFSFVFRCIGLVIKTDDKVVLFQSLIGKNYGDSPKALFDKMKNDPDFKDCKFYWAFDDPEEYVVEGAEKIKLNSIKYFITALRAGIWITNVNIERGLHFKPRKTVYLNTWHGCLPIKKDGNAQKNRKDYNFGDVDILCSSSEWQDRCFIKDYKANKKSIMRCGAPRNDILFNTTEEEKNNLRKKYGIPCGKKVILYAPTWRESSDGGKSRVIKPPIHIDYWREELSDEYVVLFRMHHLTTKALKIEYDDFVRNCSGPFDINDLMKMSDVLITDYSSTLGDYAILERPAVFFAYDYEEYYKTRGLNKRLEDLLPGCVCRNENELIEKIKHMDYAEEREKVKTLKKKYIYSYNDSTDKCLKKLKELQSIRK